MQQIIEEILEKYPNFRRQHGFGGDHEIKRLFMQLADDVKQIPSVKDNPNLLVKYSYGKGNWAAVPWLAILDSRETTTTQDGTYIVLLFGEDGNGCTLKIGQGVTRVQQQYGKKGAVEVLKNNAEKVRRMVADTGNSNFDVMGDAKRNANTGIAQLYETSTIFSRSMERGHLPDSKKIQADIEALVTLYGIYVEKSLEADDSDENIEKDRGRIWAIAAGERGRLWQRWQDESIVSIGWRHLGRLNQYSDQQAITDKLQQLSDAGTKPTNDSLCCHQFVSEMMIGDFVIAKTGRKDVFGVGIVESDYIYDGASDDHPNLRRVKWLRTDASILPGTGVGIKTLTDVTPYKSCVDFVNLYLEGIDHFGSVNAVDDSEASGSRHYSIDSIIDEGCFVERDSLKNLINALRRKRNLILQGPPGTGKTWLAKRIAYALIGAKKVSRVRSVQFHPNLSYEDFVRGWRPSGDGKLSLMDGIFMEAVEDAKNSSHPLVLVIEEINRGNPAQIFGEMLTLLEADKRNPQDALELSYRKAASERVYIPENLFIIGTMNVADRSLAMVDMALRRRFAFHDMQPMFNNAWRTWLQESLGFSEQFVSRIGGRIAELNEKICEDPRLGPQYAIGHSYLTPPSDFPVSDPEAWYRDAIAMEVGPLLSEYWYDDPALVEQYITALLS